MATLIEQGLSEGSVEKARTVIRSTWNLMHSPGAVADKLSKSAAKINAPKGRGYQQIWDLPYLHQYYDDVEMKDLDYTRLVENVIMKIKASTGWRSDDLCGLYLDHSFRWVEGGVYVRVFNAKARQNAWSPPVFLPALHERFRRLCVPTAIRELMERVRPAQGRSHIRTHILSPGGERVQAIPLFCKMRQLKTSPPSLEFAPFASATIGNYFSRAFLENINDGGMSYAERGFKAHSSRHAVASALSDMGVQAASIASLTLNSAATLQSTYILPVDRTWEIPKACVDAQKHLAAKLLVPLVHWASEEEAGRSRKSRKGPGRSRRGCFCSEFVQD